MAANGTYGGESVWGNPDDNQSSPHGSGGGGGFSSFFAQPGYQSGTGIISPYRMVPDVSADADPLTGYSVFCTIAASECPTSGWVSIGGTSAAAPLWAGIALDTNEYLKELGAPALGSASTQIYTLYSTTQTFPAYHDVVAGNNLFYSAGMGYDLTTGVGTPDAWNIARDLVS